MWSVNYYRQQSPFLVHKNIIWWWYKHNVHIIHSQLYSHRISHESHESHNSIRPSVLHHFRTDNMDSHQWWAWWGEAWACSVCCIATHQVWLSPVHYGLCHMPCVTRHFVFILIILATLSGFHYRYTNHSVCVCVCERPIEQMNNVWLPNYSLIFYSICV